MKNSAFRLMFLLPLAVFAQLDPVVTRVGDERFLTADFDADGNPDTLMLHVPTGTYQILYTDAEGDVLSPVRFTGTAGEIGLHAGRVRNTTHDRLVVAGAEQNRVRIFDDSDRTSGTVFEEVQTDGIGPAEVLALPTLPLSGGPEADVLVLSTLNGAGVQVERRDGGTLGLLGVLLPGDGLAKAMPVRVKTTVDPVAGFVWTDGTGDEFLRIVDSEAALMPVLADLPLGVKDNHWVPAYFPPAQGPYILTWAEGKTDLVIRHLDTDLSLLNTAGFDVDFEVEAVAVLGTEPHHVLVLYAGGQLARLYEYDGANQLTLLQSYAAPAGGAITGAARLGGGTFALMTAAEADGKTEQVSVMDHSGPPYKLLNSYGAGAPPRMAGSNVFLFSGEPFVDANPQRVYTGLAPDWTAAVQNSGGEIEAVRETDGGVEAGLGAAPGLMLGSWPAAPTFGLANQLSEDLSVVSLETPLGGATASAVIDPEPGYYEEAVEISFEAAPLDALVYYRVALDGVWGVFPGPFFLASDRTYHFYAQTLDGVRGPVQTASYSFPGPDDMDSDGDGVPDYVEIAKGLDPFGGFDTDGDGWTDLDELIYGSLAGFSDSVPAEDPENPLPRYPAGGSFDLELTLLAYNRDVLGSGEPEAVTGSTVTVRARTLAGELIGSGTATDGVAVLRGLPGIGLMTVATPANFRVPGDPAKTADASEQSGREMLQVVISPEINTEPIAYPHGGGNDVVETNAWIVQAAVQLLTAQPVVVADDLHPHDTLAALLFEHGLGQLLAARGEVAGPEITLFPHRVQDTGLPGVSGEMLEGLKREGPGGEAAILPEAFWGQIEAAVAAGLGKMAVLKTLVLEVYEASALQGNSTAAMPGPVETIRGFLRDGSLPAAYVPHVSLSAQDLVDARGAGLAVSLNPAARPHVDGWLLRMPAAGTGGAGCTVLEDELGAPVALVDGRGVPFLLPMSFDVTAGMRFLVSGFPDAVSGCAGQGLEVTSFVFAELVAGSAADGNGNLLPDAYEGMLQSGTGGPELDSDGDGYSDLQELLDGSDPQDGFSMPAGAAVSLSLPEIELAVDQSTQVEWTWPAAYQEHFTFALEETDDLGVAFVSRPLVPETEGDVMRLVIPDDPEARVRFYRVSISLNP